MSKRHRWTNEALAASASKFKTKPEWRTGDKPAYTAAYHRGKAFVDSICAHMPVAAHVKFATEEDLARKAKEYKTRTEWHRDSKWSFELSCALGKKKHDANCAHMPKHAYKKSRFTKAVCLEEAKRFSTRTSWAKGAAGSYSAARGYGKQFFDRCCKHMTPPKKWTKAQIIATARRFKRITDWRGAYPGQYLAARRRDWIKSATAHMRAEDKGVPTLQRYVYRIDSTVKTDEGTMRYVYIGLTAHKHKRMSVHSCISSDKGWLMALPHTKVVWKGPFDPLAAANKEQAAILYWRKEEAATGHVCVLNRNSGGGLGGFGKKSALERMTPGAFPSTDGTDKGFVLGA